MTYAHFIFIALFCLSLLSRTHRSLLVSFLPAYLPTYLLRFRLFLFIFSFLPLFLSSIIFSSFIFSFFSSYLPFFIPSFLPPSFSSSFALNPITSNVENIELSYCFLPSSATLYCNNSLIYLTPISSFIVSY